MALKIIGKVYQVGNVQSIPSRNGGQDFVKRELVLDATRFDGLTGERGFDNFPAFEFSGDKCSELDKFKVGDVVEVSFELQGSFYKGTDGVEKNFTRVRAYKIEPYAVKQRPVQQTQPAQAPQAAPQQAQQAAQPPYHQPSDFPPPSRQSDLPW